MRSSRTASRGLSGARGGVMRQQQTLSRRTPQGCVLPASNWGRAAAARLGLPANVAEYLTVG